MKDLYFAAERIALAGFGTIGVDLYVGTMPADVMKGAMLRPPLTGAPIDEGQEDFYLTSFQLIVRDPDPAIGYQRALDISKALRMSHADTPDIHIVRIAPDTLPISYPRGDADDIETSVRFLCAWGDKTP